MEGEAAAEQFSLPSTRDVLGAHLHQKVSSSLNGHLTEAKKMVSDECILADKITGMLLERSLKDILAMLQDDAVLLRNVKVALEVLRKAYPEQLQTPTSGRFEERPELSLDGIGEVLFERVCSIEESLAPQITGMILELDVPTLLHIINTDGSLLESAVQKAKEVLLSETFLIECPPGPHSLFSHPELILKDVSCQSQGEVDDEPAREILGEQIYERVRGVHPECASDLTGMILELEPQVIKLLLQDQQQLEVAIAKAYTEWKKHS
ncbi:unnamed protein product [Candidula unifasciata]|uniref:PABC domain-containing protein n=1 Tax=Candidula unifasciata TaxID=100452 RepID=A0A8S3ZX20_9EUPU|nr:unnamed protein product [Candidula unifasciata]